jgi:hypothetical protein
MESRGAESRGAVGPAMEKRKLSPNGAERDKTILPRRHLG